MTSPGNGESVASTRASISFDGYVTAPQSRVTISASPARSGTYTPFLTTTSSSQAFLGGLYGFDADAVVPSWAPGCGGMEAFVQGEVGDYSLLSFDAQNPEGQSPIQCIVSEMMENGGGLSGAVLGAVACRSQDSPIARLVVPPASVAQPVNHTGDIVIASAQDAVEWACLESLTGSLTITDPSVSPISLLNLSSVSGDLTLHFPAYVPPPPEFPLHRLRTIDLPRLASVGGSVTLLTSGTGPTVNADFRLPGLETVGGSLAIDVAWAFSMTLSGLPDLSSLSGNLSIVSGGGDTTDGVAFLSSLEEVGGSVFLDLGHNVFGGLLNALSVVQGNFVLVDGNPKTASLTGLTTVGGDMAIGNTTYAGVPTADYGYPNLSSVGGVLSLLAGYDKPNLRIGDANGLMVGGLFVQGTGLQTMSAAHLGVAGNGPVTIQDNPGLCTSLVDAWVAGLTGWTGGPALVSGNDDC